MFEQVWRAVVAISIGLLRSYNILSSYWNPDRNLLTFRTGVSCLWVFAVSVINECLFKLQRNIPIKSGKLKFDNFRFHARCYLSYSLIRSHSSLKYLSSQSRRSSMHQMDNLACQKIDIELNGPMKCNLIPLIERSDKRKRGK